MNSAGVFTIEAGHPALPGHFPGQPIVPGVVLLDHAVLRIAAALGCAPQPCRLASVKFLATVAPNEPVMVRYAASMMTNPTIRPATRPSARSASSSKARAVPSPAAR